MALVAGKTVSASGTGNTNHITLPKGDHTILVTAGAWGGAKLQIGDGTNFVDHTTFAANGYANVPGGMSYRLNVTSYAASVITLAAYPTNG